MRKNIVTAAIVAATMSACGYANVGPGEQAVVQDGYFMIPTDPKLTGCIEPEHSENQITNDVYRYPARQISWDATGGQGAERGPYVVVSNAEAPTDLNVPVVVTFDMTADCEQLKSFHRDFGTKYQGWLNEDGTPSAGWTELLNYVIGQPMEQTLIGVGQKYPWRKIWNDEAVRIEFQQALQKTLPQASKARTNGQEFFKNFQVTVLKPGPVDGNLTAAINREQSAVAAARADEAQGVADANARKAKADADVQAAIAETKVAEQEALQKRAQIAGYPDVDSYLRALCIERNCNPFQPVIVPQP
jgi:hypothetical protein